MKSSPPPQQLPASIPTTTSVATTENRVLDFKAVHQLVPVSKSTLMRWERSGKFPRRVRMSMRSIGWLESEVQTFIATRPRGLAM